MQLFSFLSKQLAPLTLVGAVVAYLYPPSFLIFADTFLWFFAATMLALGVVLEPAELKRTLEHPHRVLLGVLTQYTVMPLLGFAVATLSGLPPELALGFVIVGAAPGAMASNVIVYLAGGALAFSIAMTTVATFLSPLLTPMLVQWLGGAFLPVAFWPLFITIIWTVLVPLLLGMGLRRIVGPYLPYAVAIGPAIAAVAIVVICSYAVAANQPRIATVGPSVFGYVVLVNVLGYAAGWSLAKLFPIRLPSPARALDRDRDAKRRPRCRARARPLRPRDRAPRRTLRRLVRPHRRGCEHPAALVALPLIRSHPAGGGAAIDTAFEHFVFRIDDDHVCAALIGSLSQVVTEPRQDIQRVGRKRLALVANSVRKPLVCIRPASTAAWAFMSWSTTFRIVCRTVLMMVRPPGFR